MDECRSAAAGLGLAKESAMMSRLRLAVLGSLVASSSCAPERGPVASLDAGVDASGSAEGSGSGEGSGAQVPTFPDEPAEDLRGVVMTDRLGDDPVCADPAACTAEYEAFRVRAAAYARPIDLAEVPALLRRIDAGTVAQVAPRLSAAALRETVLDGLGIGFLMPGLDARTLEVGVLSRTDRGTFVEMEVELRDPWVGSFGAILLMPAAPTGAALLAVHGHGDTASIYRDDYHGADHAARGYVTLMLDMRAMGSGPAAITEHVIARSLMSDGFSLMGMRVYESLLGLKFLRSLAEVEAGRVTLIGHSGGSSTGNLTVRVEPRIAGYISDHQVAYAEWVEGINVYHCETVPSLFAYSEQLNDPADSPVPMLKVPYKYSNGMQELFDFLDARTAR
jgi:hypothetical protein